METILDTDKTILLVEDESIISITLAKSINHFGYNVISVNSGEKAVKVCSENDNISLVLMDLDLGAGLSGPDAAKEILKNKNIPVVFLTAHSGQQMVESVSDIPHYGYVIKSSGDFLLKSSVDLAFQLFDALEKVKAAEKNYHEIFDSSNDALFIHDGATGALLDVNQTMLEMYGYSDKSEILQAFNDNQGIFDKGCSSEEIKELVQLGLKSGKKILEWRAKKKNGDMFWVEVSLSRIRIDDSDRIIATVRDITERKNAEKSLVESEARFKSIIELAPDAFLLGDPAGKIIEANERASEISGYNYKELVGQNINIIFSEEEKKRVPLRYDLLQQGLVVTNDRILTRKDGSTVFISMNTKMMPGGIYQTFIRDISDRKRAEDILAAEKERLAVTLRSIGDGVITTDIFSNILIMNKVAEDLTGWSQNEAEGKPLTAVFNIIDEANRKECENPAEKVLETGAITELENNTLLISRNGTQRIIADSGAPIKDNNNQIIGVVIVFRDMTEKRRLLDAVQQTDRLNSLGVLAGGIAHDFNNLLSGIFGYIEMAKLKSSADKTVSDYLDKAFTVFSRAKDLTQQLLTFSKGGMPVRKTGDMRTLIRDSAAFALSGSNITCEFSIDENLRLCDFDENQIAQVIDNIIINSKQAMPIGGKIFITAVNYFLDHQENPLLRSGDYIKISIADTGIGIPSDHLKRIFDPFFTTKQQGNGLGLATCYSIIKKHDGFIGAESVPGKGSTFNILLPASEKEIAHELYKASMLHSGSGKILVMDDEVFIRDISREMLKLTGYSSMEACDGEEALMLIADAEERGEPFDGVILDLTIPGGMGGKDTIVEIRKLYPDLPVFASSGFSEDPVISNPEDSGFTGSIRKPYRRDELTAMLNKYMPKRSINKM